MRGEKFCVACKGRNGPRAFQCVHCGKGFVVKGKQQPDINPSDRDANKKEAQQSGLDHTERQRLKALVATCREHQEARLRTKFWGPKSKTLQSIDGKYRIRYCPEFLGVSIKLDDNKPYRLLKLTTNGWEPTHPKSRFKKVWAAIKYMVALQENKIIKSDNPRHVQRRRMKRQVCTT